MKSTYFDVILDLRLWRSLYNIWIIFIVLKDPPDKEFQTIALQESNVSNGYQQDGFQETGFANFDQANYSQPPPEGAAAATSANPFKNQAPQNNPFR